MNTLEYLWRNREKPDLISKRFIVKIAKRLFYAKDLYKLLQRKIILRYRGATIGKLSIIEGLTIKGVTRNLIVGDYTFIGEGVDLSCHGIINIGNCVVINSGAKLLTGSHSLRDPTWHIYMKNISVGDYAWIATSAIILPGVKIGKGAVVGAGAVVRSDVPDYSIVAGNPATIVGRRLCESPNYNPVIFSSPYEAWTGKNFKLKEWQ